MFFKHCSCTAPTQSVHNWCFNEGLIWYKRPNLNLLAQIITLPVMCPVLVFTCSWFTLRKDPLIEFDMVQDWTKTPVLDQGIARYLTVVHHTCNSRQKGHLSTCMWFSHLDQIAPQYVRTTPVKTDRGAVTLTHYLLLWWRNLLCSVSMFKWTEKLSYDQSSIGLFSQTTVLMPIHMHRKEIDLLTEVCVLGCGRWRYVFFHLVSIGPLLVDPWRHMPFHFVF